MLHIKSCHYQITPIFQVQGANGSLHQTNVNNMWILFVELLSTGTLLLPYGFYKVSMPFIQDYFHMHEISTSLQTYHFNLDIIDM